MEHRDGADPELSTGSDSDSVRAYLGQVGKIALLDAAQEVELAQQIEAGLYAAHRLRRAEVSGQTLDLQLRRELR